MVVTKELLKILFRQYNDKYFYGKLGKCDFSFFPQNLSILGKYNSNNDKNGKSKDKIWIGTSVIWTEEHLQRILIHEMVHMYVYRVEGHKYDGVLGHGWRFRRQCRRIRKIFGIEVLKLPNVEFINKKFSPKLWERILLWIFDR